MSIDDQWESYREDVMPFALASGQLLETRRAFYSGAWCVLNLINNIGTDAFTEEQGAEVLEDLKARIEAFQARIGVDR
jgi:hypothetical protein